MARCTPRVVLWEDAMIKCDAMDRYYRHGEFEGNVLFVWRDHEAEALAAAGPLPGGECDAEIAECALVTYLCAKRDGFCRHPEFRAGVEVHCENCHEAVH